MLRQPHRAAMTPGSPRSPRIEAAVLVPVYDAPAGRIVVLVRRRAGGVHGDQLAFPGGKREATDASPLETALRESEEEIGLSRRHVRATEALPPMNTATTRFRIHAFLAWIQRPPSWSPDPREVAEVIEVPVTELLAPDARGTMRLATPGYPDGREFAYIRVGSHRLWGATYRLLEPLLPRLAAPDEGSSPPGR